MDARDIDSYITRHRGKPTEIDGLAITPERMTNNLAAELVEAIDNGDFEIDDRSAEFIESNLGRTHFSVAQKRWIYDLARRYRLI